MMLLKYCKSLKFEEDPNYVYIKELLKDVFTRNKYEYDYIFDWTTQSFDKKKVGEQKKESASIEKREEEK